jgi:hypothetical protein
MAILRTFSESKNMALVDVKNIEPAIGKKMSGDAVTSGLALGINDITNTSLSRLIVVLGNRESNHERSYL